MKSSWFLIHAKDCAWSWLHVLWWNEFIIRFNVHVSTSPVTSIHHSLLSELHGWARARARAVWLLCISPISTLISTSFLFAFLFYLQTIEHIPLLNLTSVHWSLQSFCLARAHTLTQTGIYFIAIWYQYKAGLVFNRMQAVFLLSIFFHRQSHRHVGASQQCIHLFSLQIIASIIWTNIAE